MDNPKRKKVKRTPRKPVTVKQPESGLFTRIAESIKMAINEIDQRRSTGGRFFYYRLLEAIVFWILAIYFCSLLIQGEAMKLFGHDGKKSVDDKPYLENPHKSKRLGLKKHKRKYSD